MSNPVSSSSVSPQRFPAAAAQEDGPERHAPRPEGQDGGLRRVGDAGRIPCPGGGLIAEHMAVRTGVGLFDVSHMGEIQFRGPGALAAVQHITMNDAARLAGWAGALLRAAHAAGDLCGRHPGAPAGRERLSAGGECRHQG